MAKTDYIYTNKDGYNVAVLKGRNGKPAPCRVDRLVAEAFVPNPDNKKYIRHKDGNKLNNAADNLEWTDDPQ